MQRSTPSIIFLACVLLFLGAGAAANETLRVGDVVAQPGSKVQGQISIGDTGDGVATAIPITVVNGRRNGLVLALVSGIHGSEHAPIVALQNIGQRIAHDNMRGAVILVHIANLPAFKGRTIYFGPNDLKNLNRSFPGNAAGSVTERIAHALTEQVIKQSDYLIDIHAGDANESLRPSYSAYYAEAGGAELIAESKRLADAFGLDTIVQFAGELEEAGSVIYTSAQAVSLGVPAIDIESGELGLTGAQYVRPIVAGVFSVLYELDILPGDPTPAELPLYISDRARVNSDHDGIWYPSDLIRSGDFVSAGTKLGSITDYHGNQLADINAPASGVLLILFGTPPVNKGDSLAVIGSVEEH